MLFLGDHEEFVGRLDWKALRLEDGRQRMVLRLFRQAPQSNLHVVISIFWYDFRTVNMPPRRGFIKDMIAEPTASAPRSKALSGT